MRIPALCVVNSGLRLRTYGQMAETKELEASKVAARRLTDVLYIFCDSCLERIVENGAHPL